MRRSTRRRVCFVTGTRAEFGLMRATLEAIRSHAKLQLQLVVTGMHLDRTRGHSIQQVKREGWTVDAVVPWKSEAQPAGVVHQTGSAIARLARVFERLDPHVVLVVGDRVEAFAAAAAAHISCRLLAHVHGGDRAQGQVDDSLRHAITKLSHLHFPATRQSARRIIRLGEDKWRVHLVGTPGLDDLPPRERSRERQCIALVVLHPVDGSESLEYRRGNEMLQAVRQFPFDRIEAVDPNNDPGARGIVRAWREQARRDARITVRANLARTAFLQLMRDASVMVGNSSSGIIEAASVGTPVIDVGPRQRGRQRSKNVTSVPYGQASVERALDRIWNNGRPRRFAGRNVYGEPGAGKRIARVLSNLPNDIAAMHRKLIAY